jgi:predicted DCC family thiol-disulfide oxidoreductase YuxK
MDPAITTPGAHGTPTVYYDGGCPVCTREIAMYRQLSREAALARLHLRGPDGQLVSGAAAFTGMWREMPRWRWLGVFFGKGWRLAALEGAYRAFLRVRRAWRRA